MIYLDNNATSLIIPEVKNLMDEIYLKPYNPSSVHSYGRYAKGRIEEARRQLSNLVGIKENYNDYLVCFTSSGTEANNLLLDNFKYADIFISCIEHNSILACCDDLQKSRQIKVLKNGIIDLDDLEEKLSSSENSKKIVSIMAANNETGILQPLKEISKVAKKHGAIFHSDAAQILGKLQFNMLDIGLDFITLSGHKFGAPIGAGALIGRSDIYLESRIKGGGQEKGLRSGTENVAAIIGLGKAAEIVNTELEKETKKLKFLQEKLEEGLKSYSSDIKIVGEEVDRLPNTTLIINKGKKAATQLIAFDMQSVALSSGAACSSGKISPSHVLKAMGYHSDEVDSAIRVSTFHMTTEKEIDEFLEIFKQINKR